MRRRGPWRFGLGFRRVVVGLWLPRVCRVLRRSGDTLVVTKLDRLARSLRDAKDIVDDLTLREVKLSTGGSVHD